MKRFSIGGMARMFHVSVSSLRHHGKEGLLQPERVDPRTGPMDTVQLVQVPACRLTLVESLLEIHGFLDMQTPIRGLEAAGGEAVILLGKVGFGISQEHLAAQELGCTTGSF